MIDKLLQACKRNARGPDVGHNPTVVPSSLIAPNPFQNEVVQFNDVRVLPKSVISRLEFVQYTDCLPCLQIDLQYRQCKG